MAFNLKDDPRMQQRLHAAAALLSTPDFDPPPADIAALEGLSVSIPAPTPPTESEILQRFRDRLRDHAKVTPRKPGDLLALGDEICVDMIAHHNGAIVAGSIKHAHWMELVPDASLIGLCEQLIGVAVGATVVVPVVLEDGRTAAAAVRVLEAQAVEMPDPESGAAVAALGKGATLEATLTALGRELLEEAEQSSPVLAMRATMHALGTLAVVDVPDAAVDAEIQRAWRAAEGEGCVALGLSVDEQQEALRLWLTDPAVRQEVLLGLKSWAALKAIVIRDKLAPSDQGWARFYESFAPALGLTPAAARAEVEKDPKLKAELEEHAFRMQVVDHIMASVTVDIR